MKQLSHRVEEGFGREVADTLTLPFELRQRSRQRARLDRGEEVALLLPRGTVLREGDLLQGEDGERVRVRAAVEDVSTVTTSDPTLLARVCYHLGNRHAALQIGAGWVRYLRDHVLDGLVRELGLDAVAERATFEPEAGAYHRGQAHAHD